jgi:SSS family transporter
LQTKVTDNMVTFSNSAPPFLEYQGKESFFGSDPPLPEGVGWGVVLGFGLLFSIITTIIVFVNRKYGNQGAVTSEHFNTAGRSIKTGLTASVIVSQWTWAATLLQSSNVAWQYGVSGPFWYASGATIQVILFGVLAISLKKVAPSAHTVCEIVNARWGRTAHKTFLFFCFCANLIVTSMLLLGGAATVEALTGLRYEWASFFIPWGVILYTASGGLQATFLASYIHTVIIFGVLVTMVFYVYIKTYSSDDIYDFLQTTISYTSEECAAIYEGYEPGKFACGPVDGNKDGSYLTMLSSGGLMFGIINIVGNFGTVFVDQSYWQSAIAARPASAARGYVLGGICWFAIPFTLATSLGLASTALLLPITDSEAGNGLVPPAVATHLLGDAGSVLILIMLFMAIVSTGSAESIAVSSLFAYDIYREYFNPEATGDQILKVSRIVIVVFGLAMGGLSIVLHELGLSLGWVYLFMGICIGSAVAPLWFLMKWSKASGTGAVVAAWSGLVFAVIAWIVTASVREGEISIDSLGTNEAMLTGNLVAILSSALVHVVYSIAIDPQDFDFSTLDEKIKLVEDDTRGLTAEDQDPEMLAEAERWIARRGYALSLILVVVWPLLSIPAGTFTKNYFAFWVLVAIAWGFGAAIVIAILPLLESSDDIGAVFSGCCGGSKGEAEEVKKVEEVEEKVEEPVEETPEENSA